MSEIWVNTFKNENGNGAPNFPNGVTVTGIITASTLNQNVTGDVNIGSNIKQGAASGVVTATTFVGNLTGAATQLATNATGANLTLSGNLGVGGTITYEDVARVDATGISTFREGFKVGPLAGIAATYYSDGSVRTTGIVTAASFYGDGANLSNLPASAPVGGATTNKVFFNNDQTVWNSYTIPANTNSGTFGPIQVAAGQTVTIPSGSYWTIV